MTRMNCTSTLYTNARKFNLSASYCGLFLARPFSFEDDALLFICLMIHPRTGSIRRVRAKDLLLNNTLCFCLPARHYSHLGRAKSKAPTTKNSKQPSRHSQHRRKPDPFVTKVKEVEDPDEALSLFYEYRRMGFRHDYPSYSALIYKLARSRSFEAVEEILSRVEETDVRCRESLFIALIRHYGKVHLVDKAVRLFQRMTDFNCTRTLQSFNTILNVLVENDRLLDAVELLHRSYKMGFRPNSVSFNVIMKGWLEKGEWETACKVFDEMLEKKVQPTVVTYNSLVGFLCRKGDVERAMGLLEDMTHKGKYPNASTYALLMEGLCLLGKYEEAKKLMFDMEYKGCKPAPVNFGVLMSDLGKRGETDKAKELLKEMKRRKCKPDVVSYNILVNYLCKEGRPAEAYKLLVEMQIEGREPNAATYRMMLDGFCKVEDFQGGLKVLNAMLTSKHCPMADTYCHLVEGLLRNGNIDDACFVVEGMEKRKIRVELESWEVLASHACRADGGAMELLTELSLEEF
ncbi:hypothetical protein EUGRSUZ_E02818 [Eucalyptus grandis]|uniref:Uncharacterized protein n=2 Tax=Eucalyptus grandis TaxID=71139 RepID=A0ACC3KXL3_EUCGR|nr:hypothetical protein EUGRSUZ_E02818 [Eucalyptus grandis]